MGSWTLFLTPGELAGPWKGFSIWQGSQHWQRIMSRGCTHQLLVLEPDLHQQQPGWGSAPPPLCFPLCLLPPPVTNPEPGPVVCFMDKIIPSRGTARAQLPLRAAGFSCQALSSTVPLGASEVSCSQKGHVGTSQRQRGSSWSSTRTSGLQQGHSGVGFSVASQNFPMEMKAWQDLQVPRDPSKSFIISLAKHLCSYLSQILFLHVETQLNVSSQPNETLNLQSRIRNKQHLPSAPIPGHFPFLMTAVTLQAQHCSPAVPGQKSPVKMSLHSPPHVHFPVQVTPVGPGWDQTDLWTCQGSFPPALCDTGHLWPALPHPCPTLGSVTGRAQEQSCPCTAPTLQVSFHQESQGERGLLWAPAASPGSGPRASVLKA